MASLISPDGKYLVLTKFSIEGKTSENLNEITIFQTFVNSSQEIIEGSYLYPKDSNCAISSLQIKSPTGIIKGQVHEIEESKEKYNDAIAAGQKTFLSHTVSYASDLMAIYVGNIPSESEVEVQITLVSESTYNSEDNKWKIYFPNKFIQRYNKTQYYADSPFNVVQPEVEICASFIIKSHENICSVSSNVRNFNVEAINSKHSIISLKFANNSDLRVTYELENSDSPWASIQQDPRTQLYGFQLSFTPEHPANADISEWESKGEFIILLDRSGSMSSNSNITLAKQALCLFLKSLPEDSYFNIVSFGSEYDPMFEKSQKYTDENIEYAINLINRFGADMGGTEIYGPLCDALTRSLKKNPQIDNIEKKGFFEKIFTYFRRNKPKNVIQKQINKDDISLYRQYIILITDGGVSNADQIVSMIKKSKGEAMISTIGIGHGASTYLINEVAKAGGGSSQHILDSKEIKPAVISSLKGALMPGYSQIQFLNPKIFEILSPKMPFKCHHGEKIICYGVIDENQPFPSVLDIKYVSDLTNTEMIVEIPINETEIDQNSAALVTAVGKYFDTCNSHDLVSKSIKFQVLSKVTAFLGVENAVIKSNRQNSGNLLYAAREIGAEMDYSVGCSLKMAEPPKKSSGFSFFSSKKCKKSPKERSVNYCCSELSHQEEEEEEEVKAEVESKAKQIEDLIAFQKIDGHWECSSEVKILVKRILNSKKNIKNESAGLITALILAIFEEKFKEFENIWCLVAAKSKKWLKKSGFQEVRLVDLGYN